MTLDLAAVEARLAAASPAGKWAGCGYNYELEDGEYYGSSCGPAHIVRRWGGVEALDEFKKKLKADQDLIENAPADIRALVAWVKEAIKVLRMLEYPTWEYSTGWSKCKLCHGWEPFVGPDDRDTSGHRDNCPLAALLTGRAGEGEG